jgi:hypothetical protein
MIRTSSIAGLVLGCAFAGSVAADGFEFDPGNMYAGGGIGINSVSFVSDDATGFQIFGGYNFGEIFGVENLDLLVEVGYMDSGDFDQCVAFNFFTGECLERESFSATGLWSTGGVAYRINPQWSVFGRAGLDFGDDDGFMIGAGGAFHMNEQLEFRLELVERDNISSLQVNVAFDF